MYDVKFKYLKRVPTYITIKYIFQQSIFGIFVLLFLMHTNIQYNYYNLYLNWVLISMHITLCCFTAYRCTYQLPLLHMKCDVYSGKLKTINS